MPVLFVDNLCVIDCSVLDPKRGLIGASWIVDLELGGDLNEQSMIFDFAKVKRRVKQWIDSEVDHKLLVPTQFAGCQLSNNGEQSKIEFRTKSGEEIIHLSPRAALCLIDEEKASKKRVASFIKRGLKTVLPDNVQHIEIGLRKEISVGAYYTYSHGLKKHDGNCQRIAHGHRSRVEIWRNGRRSSKHEHQLARRWQDIYIGTAEDVREYASGKIVFAYKSAQGEFELVLPESRVHLMQQDSTVECIAEHILTLLEEQSPKDNFKVRAFEGVAKGAIAESD